MALQGSGEISINNINVELGRSGTTQAALNDSALRTLAGVASGAIAMSNFYGKANAFTFSVTIASNTTDYNLKNAAVAAGYDGSGTINASVTINAGVVVSATSTGSYAFSTGSGFGAGSTLALTNNGTIIGKGGNGGNGGTGYTPPGAWTAQVTNAGNGTNGGPALLAQTNINITNNGTIAGGGGGGGGGAMGHNAGA